jgi:DNA uptake protein ComE-like DNA-binding protein
MKHSIIKIALIAMASCLSAGLSLAADPPTQQGKQTGTAGKAKAAASTGKAAAPRVAPVDINSASKEELKKLPGIGDAEADKIIAGRPYLTKAHLQTHNIISPGAYRALQSLVVARQKDAKFIKEKKK